MWLSRWRTLSLVSRHARLPVRPADAVRGLVVHPGWWCCSHLDRPWTSVVQPGCAQTRGALGIYPSLTCVVFHVGWPCCQALRGLLLACLCVTSVGWSAWSHMLGHVYATGCPAALAHSVMAWSMGALDLCASRSGIRSVRMAYATACRSCSPTIQAALFSVALVVEVRMKRCHSIG